MNRIRIFTFAVLCALPVGSMPPTANAVASGAAARALSILEDPQGDRGWLPVTSVILVEPDAPDNGVMPVVAVEVLADLSGMPGLSPESQLRLTVVLAQIDGEPVVLEELLPAGASKHWYQRRDIALPEDFLEAAVIVEEPGTGLWGGASALFSDRSLRPAGTPMPVTADAGSASRSSSVAGTRPVVIRVLPPRSRPVVGRVKIEAVTSLLDIDRVDFLLDGRKAASDDSPPFAATLEFDATPKQMTLKVAAYAENDLLLGTHEITVNEERRPFRVRISGVDGGPSAGAVTINAEVSVPIEAKLDRVAFYLNENQVAELTGAPYRARIDTTTAGPEDFIRVAAYLVDGSVVEDAMLLSAPGPSERLEVNLVELFAVVLDKDRAPLRSLNTEDFTIRLRGSELPIQSMTLADEVPLILGLVIDTSESMWPLMPDTKKAGAQFLAGTVREGDQAFLVDFDTRPRLAHGASGDVVALMRAFAGLQAEGATALYDAIIFSLVQFEETGGRRKALVLLTDGDDYKSRFPRRRCIDYGRQLGVPVYIIALGGVQDPRRGFRRIDLEGITRATGGEVFNISDMSELTGAYAGIEAELRSQYLITFATDRPLSDGEIEDLVVDVRGKGLTVRAVVGDRRVE